MGAPNRGSIPLNDRSLEAERSAPATLSERVQALFQQFRVPVFRYLLRKTRNPGTAEDLTQETFLRLCRHLRDEMQKPIRKRFCFVRVISSSRLICQLLLRFSVKIFLLSQELRT
jgi:DNA-directed RNA polymerase specialized sigma24 family protein